MDSIRDRFRGWLVDFITSKFPNGNGVPEHLAAALYERDPEELPLFGESRSAWTKASSTWPDVPLNWPEKWPPLDDLAPDNQNIEEQDSSQHVVDHDASCSKGANDWFTSVTETHAVQAGERGGRYTMGKGNLEGTTG